MAVGKGLAVCDGCVCRPAIVRTVIGEGGCRSLSKPERPSETSQKPRCPPVLQGSGSSRVSEGCDLGASVGLLSLQGLGLRLGLRAEV